MLRNVFSVKLIIKKHYAIFFFIELIIKMPKWHFLIKKYGNAISALFSIKQSEKCLNSMFL
jgi:hypothetical protein